MNISASCICMQPKAESMHLHSVAAATESKAIAHPALVACRCTKLKYSSPSDADFVAAVADRLCGDTLMCSCAMPTIDSRDT